MIRELQRDHLASLGSESLLLDIRRDFVLHDAVREGRKGKFSTKKHLKVSEQRYLVVVLYTFLQYHGIQKVNFMGEEAVDAGGPRREIL